MNLDKFSRIIHDVFSNLNLAGERVKKSYTKKVPLGLFIFILWCSSYVRIQLINQSL